MSVNIMDLVKGAVSDQVMGQIGGLLGTDSAKTPSIFQTAAGSILGGMMKKTSSPQGAQDIFGAVEKQDTGFLDNLGGLLGGGQATDEFQKQGSGILDLVTGGGQQSSGMIGMVAKALGLDKGIVGKLLTMAAPILMGVVGRHVKNKALDAVGLGNLLGSQGPHVAAALPNSLTNDLGFGKFVPSTGGAAGTARSTTAPVSNAARNTADSAKSGGGGLLKLLIPLALLAAAAIFLLPKIMSGGADKTKETLNAGAGEVEGMKKFDVSSMPGFDALGETGTKLNESMSGITSGLKDVSTEEGANGLAEKISGFTGQIDGMGLDNLQGPAKTAASGVIGKFIETVKSLIGGKSDAIKGILEPVIGPLMEKLSAFQ